MLGERPTTLRAKNSKIPWSCEVSKNSKIQQIHNVARRKAVPNMANLAMHGKQWQLPWSCEVLKRLSQKQQIPNGQASQASCRETGPKIATSLVTQGVERLSPKISKFLMVRRARRAVERTFQKKQFLIWSKPAMQENNS